MIEFTYPKQTERWDVLEVICPGFTDKNPFTDYQIRGVFKSNGETKTVEGFYNGDGRYTVRFMPSFAEHYTFAISGSFSDKTYAGDFAVLPAQKGNHGPVRVANTFHFAYEDGDPYYSIGTTCYVWELQSAELQKKTLETLSKSAFNKIRFCIFPKHYDYNLGEPRSYPYEGKPMDSSVLTKENFQSYTGTAPGNKWDFKRFNTEHFQHIDNCIKALRDLNIEADLIIMHPYDRWGFSMMSAEEDDLYWNYCIARFSAFRNVWWSLANEYDLMPQKTLADWERYAALLCEKDPYKHLRSIHNCRPFYDYSRPWITHCSIQRQDLYKTAEFTTEWRERYGKPVVLDEIAYEGNIQHGWGNISGKELVRRFWEAACRGGYAGHGETFLHPNNLLWWSHGGELHGESPERFKFLLRILKETPGHGLKPTPLFWDAVTATAENNASSPDYYLIYYGFMRPSFREFYFNDIESFEVEVIDTWEMTIVKAGVYQGKFKVDLPGKEYMAIRIKKAQNL
ncbi:DUF5605 domain-containing protein [Treponema primitia]|uniref:DUF5605 domain-containing protein n=1 Tax=Treponema primitia TaxID=88058 RepID=UPI0002555000|nr:DUF5605 domain-containing protein [Treponema primitia]